MIRRLFCIAAASALLYSAAAQAADGVPVRLGVHDSYTRLVFDFSTTSHYTVGQDSDTSLVMTFDQATTLNVEGVNTENAPQVAGVMQVSGADENLKVKIDMGAAGSGFRHFTVGKRVIVDIFGPGQRAPKSSPPPPPVAAADRKADDKKETKKPDKKKTQKAAKPTKESAHEAVAMTPHAPVSVKEEVLEKPAPEKTAIEESFPDIQSHAISLSLTEAVGMASFVRNNYFWIVLDRPDVLVKPEVTGPAPEMFPSFSRHELKGGVAFRMKMPDDVDIKLYGEGGGLVWRIIATSKERAVKPAAMDRVFMRGEHVRGGSVFWPLLQTGKILKLPDPAVGDVLKVVTVNTSSQFAGDAGDFVDFSLLQSVIGLAVRPKADDLDVILTGNGVKISRTGGLAMSRDRDVKRKRMREDVTEAVIEQPTDPNAQMMRIYDFDRWMMGGLLALGQNQRILMANTVVKDKNGRVQDLLTLAKISIANDRGQEALGFLNYAANEMPALAKGAEFKALQGAAYALSGKYELAMQNFLSAQLKDFGELDYWRAFSLSWLEDWQQAIKTMPKDYSVLVGYPKALLEKMGVKLAEVALRGGDVVEAEKILSVLSRDRDSLNSWTVAGMDYLKGEAHRQSGEFDSAIDLWEQLTNGHDDFYRARGGLALTMLQLQSGKIVRKDAIDRLEGLRYAWRGDELEAQINFMTGKLYLEDRQFMKGFNILRDSASMSPGSDVSIEITTYMADAFKTLLMEDPELTPLDAITVYEQFRELTPPGDEGDLLVQKLAERVIEADLLERAAGILQHQIDFRLDGLEKAQIATRLAAVYLLDKEPDKAITVLDVAKAEYKKLNTEDAKKSLHKIELMRARAMSQMDHTEEALELLSKFDPSPDVNSLRADIAWQAGLWEDAAEALQDLILDEALDLNRPLTGAQADLVLNRSVALNLSGNRVALANMRKRYSDSMKKTARARLFDVVTRPRRSTLLTDRQTLDSLVSEVDIFKDFLEAYRSSNPEN